MLRNRLRLIVTVVVTAGVAALVGCSQSRAGRLADDITSAKNAVLEEARLTDDEAQRGRLLAIARTLSRAEDDARVQAALIAVLVGPNAMRVDVSVPLPTDVFYGPPHDNELGNDTEAALYPNGRTNRPDYVTPVRDRADAALGELDLNTESE